MDLSVEELARLLGGRAEGATPEALAATRVTGAAAIAEARGGDVTFFGNARYLPALKKCQATCALVSEDFAEEILPVRIRVANPSLAFSQVLEQFAPAPIINPPGIHPRAFVAEDATVAEGASIAPNAVIEPGACIGAGSFIGAGAYIGHGAIVGEGCTILPNVTIRERCRLGNRVTIHSGTTIGSDGFGYEFANGRHAKIPQTGIVEIGDDVEIGANVAIDRARFGRTIIGEGTKVDNLVHIAHNVVIGSHSLIIAQVGISGSARVGNYVTIAGQVGVVGHIEIGDGAIIAAKSGISKDLAAKSVVWGSPAVPLRDAKEQLAIIRRLPQLVARVRKLEQLLGSPEKKDSAES